MPRQDSEPSYKNEQRRAGRLRHYLGAFVSNLFLLAMVGALVLFLLVLPLYLLGEVMVRLLGLSWSSVVVFEAVMVILVTLLRIGLLRRRVRGRKEKMELRMLGCLFGFHDMVVSTEYTDQIGIDVHRMKISKCKYCSSKDEEMSVRYW